ncbi:MAG TPA: thiamine-binding protein [Egicoccus sp.]|nr:thiamine-binding protein [Egicoccus sp.]HSK22918.1 thiamine-binding protein [Egicoccus sp.]
MIVAFSVAPVGEQNHVGDAVAECIRAVRESGLPNETNAMFTNVEGEWDDIQALMKRCIDICERHAPRVSLVMKLDHHPGAGHEHTLAYKVERIERALDDRAAG